MFRLMEQMAIDTVVHLAVQNLPHSMRACHSAAQLAAVTSQVLHSCPASLLCFCLRRIEVTAEWPRRRLSECLQSIECIPLAIGCVTCWLTRLPVLTANLAWHLACIMPKTSSNASPAVRSARA